MPKWPHESLYFDSCFRKLPKLVVKDCMEKPILLKLLNLVQLFVEDSLRKLFFFVNRPLLIYLLCRF